MDERSLLARAGRAFGNALPSDVAKRYRAIVGPTRSDDRRVQQALEELRNGQRLSPTLRAVLEHAIAVFRPSVASSGAVPELAPEHRDAFPDWGGFAPALGPHLYAIGRIDRGPEGPESVPAQVGTGFLIAAEVLVTNRHVLEVISLGSMEVERGMAVVRFGQEERATDSEGPVAILSALSVHDSLDLALLAIEARQGGAARTPLAIDTSVPEVGAPVVAVGYPFADEERNPLFADRLFGGVYGVKRASPGEVIGAGRGVLYHDCSTLGGNSGSPLLRMSTAAVAGVHARGGFAVRNTAVGAAALAELAARFMS